jgi:sulfate-transporting ATPase
MFVCSFPRLRFLSPLVRKCSPISSFHLISSFSSSFIRFFSIPVNREGNPNRIAYSLQNVTKKLQSGRTLFRDVTLSFFDGAKIGILGNNGSGKSSLLRIIAGVDSEYDGEAAPVGGLSVGYLPQEPTLDDSLTVAENIEAGIQEKLTLLKRYDEISTLFSSSDSDIEALSEEQANLADQIEKLGLWELNTRIELAIDALRCPPGKSSVKNLSGGERRRVALCRLLMASPDILLLDEPTNHLDAESVFWLEQYLSTYRGLVIAITHDRYFLDEVAGYILEIDAGNFFPFKG